MALLAASPLAYAFTPHVARPKHKVSMTLQPMLAGHFGGWEIVILAIIVSTLAFWIWMIVDCVTSEKEANSRTPWLLVVVLAGIIGALLYYFIRKLPREAGQNQA